MTTKKTKRTRIIIAVVLAAVCVLAVTLFVQSSERNSAVVDTPRTAPLERTDIAQIVSVSGVVESGASANVYPLQSFPVAEILVQVGDSVKKGDVLARLDMSRLETDIRQAELNLANALVNADEEVRTTDNTVKNAQTSLESSQIAYSRQAANAENALKDLEDALDASEFDSYVHDNAISEAEIVVGRRLTDVKKARDDLDTAMYDFDGYTFLNQITEGEITLERRKIDLKDAQDDLTEAQTKQIEPFDDYAHENAIRDGEKQLERRKEDYNTARNDYWDKLNDYYLLSAQLGQPVTPDTPPVVIPPEGDDPPAEDDPPEGDEPPEDDPPAADPPPSVVTQKMVDAAWSAAKAAETAMNKAAQTVHDAETSLERTRTDKDRARKDYYEKSEDSLEAAEKTAQKALRNAENAVYDAERALQRSRTDLERAQRDAVKAASEKLTAAENAYSDAVRAYNKSVNDKARAISDYAEANDTKLLNAQKAYDDAQKQLQSSQNSLRASQNSLEQARNKPIGQSSNIALQELNIEKLNNQLSESEILATMDGVITEVNLKVGQTPAGILFVIENTDYLYVAARIKEHNVPAVNIGQAAIVKTDATGNIEYPGSVSYISPKAVSAAGSTSVEFEVKAGFDAQDKPVRIGMNAFLDIVTDQKTNVFTVPSSAVVTTPRGSTVFVWQNEQRVPIIVTTGIRASALVEIEAEELREGMEIIVDPEGLLSTGERPQGGMFSMTTGPAGGGSQTQAAPARPSR